jgi:hypothetical protein
MPAAKSRRVKECALVLVSGQAEDEEWRGDLVEDVAAGPEGADDHPSLGGQGEALAGPEDVILAVAFLGDPEAALDADEGLALDALQSGG